MTFAANVQGGTGAGRRIVKKQPPVWACKCSYDVEPYYPPRLHPGSRYSCPDCGARRPN